MYLNGRCDPTAVEMQYLSQADLNLIRGFNLKCQQLPSSDPLTHLQFSINIFNSLTLQKTTLFQENIRTREAVSSALGPGLHRVKQGLSETCGRSL